MTPEELIKKFDERILVLHERISVLKDRLYEKNNALLREREELKEVTEKYRKLWRVSLHMGKSAGIVIHLEEMLENEKALNDKYRKHYEKYQYFYAEYEAKMKK